LLDEHLSSQLDNFKIESFQSADALCNLHNILDIRHADDSGIEDHPHILGRLYYWDILLSIQLGFTDIQFVICLSIELVQPANSASHQTNRETNAGDS